MKLIKFFALLLFSVGLASCNNDEPGEQSLECSFPAEMNFTAVKSVSDGSWGAFPGAVYSIKFDFGTGKCDMVVSGLQYKQSDSSVSFSLSGLNFGFNQDGSWSLLNKDAITVAAAGGSLRLSDIRIYVLSRTVAGMGVPVMHVEFTIDDAYVVRAVGVDNIYFGKTTTNLISDPSDVFVSDRPYYNMKLDYKTMTGTLFIFNAQFASNMPALNMAFKNVPVTMTDEGFVFDCDELVPEIDDVPYEKYKITDLSGMMLPESTGTVSFTCAGRWTVDFAGALL